MLYDILLHDKLHSQQNRPDAHAAVHMQSMLGIGYVQSYNPALKLWDTRAALKVVAPQMLGQSHRPAAAQPRNIFGCL